MSDSYTPCTDQARRAAERKDIDIDAVREIETDADGVTVRVLLQDAESEADQVGFDVTRPPAEVQMGDKMFREQLNKGLDKLKRYAEGDDPVPSGAEQDQSVPGTAETPDTDPRTDVGAPEQATTGRSSDPPTDHRTADTERAKPPTQHTEVGVSVSMAEDSLETLRDELESAIEDTTSDHATTARVDEIEGRIEDLDERLTALEEQLSMLGQSE